MATFAEITIPDSVLAPPPSTEARAAHVLFLIDELCGKGGAESALLNTVRWLPTRFRCSVITFRIDEGLPMLAEFPCPVRVLPMRRTYGWNAVKMALRLRTFIRSENVDIVHTFFPSSDLWGGAIARLSRKPALISGRRDLGILRKPIHRIGYRALRGIFDRVLTNSDEVRKYSIEQDGLDPAKVKTIYNGIDTSKFHGRSDVGAIRTAFGIESGSHVIASVGNLRTVKGFDSLIRAAATVCREFPDAVFVIAGADDPAEPNLGRDLRSLSQSLGIARNVRFLGGLSDVSVLLNSSDVFCLLSHSEGFSNALIEAMACGLPCVATRVGGNAEAVIDGDNGFIVQPQDPVSASARIIDLLRNPVRAKAMGEQGRKLAVARFSSQAYISNLAKAYDEVLAHRC